MKNIILTFLAVLLFLLLLVLVKKRVVKDSKEKAIEIKDGLIPIDPNVRTGYFRKRS